MIHVNRQMQCGTAVVTSCSGQLGRFVQELLDPFRIADGDRGKQVDLGAVLLQKLDGPCDLAILVFSPRLYLASGDLHMTVALSRLAAGSAP